MNDIDHARELERFRFWLEDDAAGPGLLDLVVEEGADLAHALSLPLPPGSRVFAHEDADPASTSDGDRERVFFFSGALDTDGGEISLGGAAAVQLESYATAPYVSLQTPTALSLTEPLDREELLSDVAAAEQTGRLPAHLLLASTTFVDQRRLLSPLDASAVGGAVASAPRRLLLRADGVLTAGPHDHAPADTPVVTAPPTTEDIRIARFVGALKVVRGLRSRLGVDVRLAEGTAPVRGAVRRDPVFVLDADDQCFVVDVLTGRLHRVPIAVGDVVSRALADAAGEPGARPDAQTRQVFDALGLGSLLHGRAAA